jgi:hypothetical protein
MSEEVIPPWDNPDLEWVCEIHGIGPLGICIEGCAGPWMLAAEWIEGEDQTS